MSKNILVTGGAGFIGSFLVDQLVEEGHKITILDNLDHQIHPNGEPPAYMNAQAQLLRGDVTDRPVCEQALMD